jgi:hypothetical protein
VAPRWLSALAGLLLAGCGPLMPHLEPKGPPMQAGHYEFCATVQLTETVADAQWACQRVDPWGGSDRMACAMIYRDPPHIISPAPRHVNDWERKGILGHELLHVLFGDYHR